jgi:hypothetical protein
MLKELLGLALKKWTKKSDFYNPFWRCSNEHEAQKIYEKILKRVRPFNS